MNSSKNSYTFIASSNLLGICFFIIAALRVTNLADKSWGDEISMAASGGFLAACILSYVSMRVDKNGAVIERWADYIFLFGLGLLFVSIIAFYAGY